MESPVTCDDDASQKRAKQAIRGRVRADRATRVDDAGTAARALADVAGPHLLGMASVALYVSMRHEPGTGPLRAILADAGTQVLLPWLRDDDDLDWVADERPPADAEPTGRNAAMRPPGQRLGVAAVRACAAVLLPARALDTAGRRLGQGGGSYDRVLARLAGSRPAPLLVGCVFDEEIRDATMSPLPEEPHDRRVDVALTPTRWLDLRSPSGP